MQDQLYINEFFVSIQGEGLLTGVPSTFVRLSGCNLRCRWCDTPRSSWSAEGEHRSVASLVEQVLAQKPRHVVLTGGEPLLQAPVAELCAALHTAGLHLTIETAGTVFRPVAADLMSISPKLADSTPRADPAWGPRHEAARINEDALSKLILGYPVQLKFVASSPADIDEITALLARLPPVAPDRVLLMPEGRSPEALDARMPLLVRACTDRGWRLCDRLHIRLFGDRPGT